MIFSDEPKMQAYEHMIRQYPGYREYGGGIRRSFGTFKFTAEQCECKLCVHYKKKQGCQLPSCSYLQERIDAGAAARSEILLETVRTINNFAFNIRVYDILKKEDDLLMFRNEKHEKAFNDAVQKIDRKNNPLLAAVYLLTADAALWRRGKIYLEKNGFDFGLFHPTALTENSYTLLCCAMDLLQGTKHISICDLADRELIQDRLFSLICNAMAILRYGLGAIQYKNEVRTKT